MNADPLDKLLQAYVRQPLPVASDQLASDVRRAILRRRQPFWSRLLPILDWRDLFTEPRLIAAALALALAAGIFPAVFAGRKAHAQVIRESLHFEVFSTVAPALLDQLAGKPHSVMFVQP
jgi:hypothetical protein